MYGTKVNGSVLEMASTRLPGIHVIATRLGARYYGAYATSTRLKAHGTIKAGGVTHPADAECRAMMENCAEPQWQQANTDTDTSLEALDALQTH